MKLVMSKRKYRKIHLHQQYKVTFTMYARSASLSYTFCK